MTAQPQRTTPQPPAALNGGRMGLSSIHKGTTQSPLRVLLYGPEGIGKTTFAASAPDVVFLGAEDGFGLLDVARFPEPRTWTEVLEAVRTLEIEEHPHRTLAIDTVDWLEPLCWAHVCKEGGEKSIESFNYGKGYTAALEQWRVFLSALERLRRAKSMHVILLAHAKVARFQNPEGDDYDRFALKLHEKSAGLLKEWTDAVLFAQFRVVVDKKQGADKGKAIGQPERVVHTIRRAAFEAKNRFELPEVLPLSWDAFAKYALNPRTAAQLLDEIRTLSRRVATDVGSQALSYAEKYSTDRARLVEVANKLRSILEQAEQNTTNNNANSTTEKAQ